MISSLLLLVLAGPAKLAVMPIAAGEGVEDKTVSAVTEAAVAELRRRPDLQVLTPHEISALLTLEKQKAAFGCQSESCFAEIGGALGVDRMVTGDLARLGESWLINLKVLEVARVRVAAHANRRIKGGTIDDVLDALPALVTELFPGVAVTGSKPTPTPPTVATATGASGTPVPVAVSPGDAPSPVIKLAASRPGPRVSPGVDEPYPLPADQRSQLRLYTDGKGRYLAAIPSEGFKGPFFAGDAKRFYLQRVHGGGRDGEGGFSLSFWDPRASVPAEATFDVKGGKGQLYCGRDPIAFNPVADSKARAILDRAKYLQPRWRRYSQALARDDEGRYYYVDGARSASGEPAAERAYQLFVGPKGSLGSIGLTDTVSDQAGEIYLFSGGKLRFFREGDKPAAEWTEGQIRYKLTPFDVSMSGPLVYGGLKIYGKEPLGTACDGRFP